MGAKSPHPSGVNFAVEKSDMANETPKTKGQVEAEISEALIKFEKEYMGRGPDETKTYIIDDLIVIRLQRVLTSAEQQLAKSDGDVKGRSLIKQVRTELLEKARPLLEAMVRDTRSYLTIEEAKPAFEPGSLDLRWHLANAAEKPLPVLDEALKGTFQDTDIHTRFHHTPLLQ